MTLQRTWRTSRRAAGLVRFLSEEMSELNLKADSGVAHHAWKQLKHATPPPVSHPAQGGRSFHQKNSLLLSAFRHVWKNTLQKTTLHLEGLQFP